MPITSPGGFFAGNSSYVVEINDLNPMPVILTDSLGNHGTVTVANLPTLQGVSGTVAVSTLPAITGSVTTTSASTVGTDRSANAPTGPGAATSFAYNGLTVNLLGTAIAANTSRKSLEINNTSGQPVVLVIDDGANTAGTISLFPLSAGAAQFAQGADFSTTTEQGRVRIFGTTGTYVYAREN